jgi:hypothetical protein
MEKIQFIVFLLVYTFFLKSFGIYDLRTSDIKQNGIQTTNVEKGRLLIEKAWKAQGMNNIHNFKTYSFQGKDTWKGILGNKGKGKHYLQEDHSHEIRKEIKNWAIKLKK